MCGRHIWISLPSSRAAAVGASFLDKARTEDGKLFFSLTRSGSKIRLQRKPYSGVFYALACLQGVNSIESLKICLNIFLRF